MDKTLPQRKPIRLCPSLYAQPGAYFITICTKNRKNLFWQTVGACIAGPQSLCLTELLVRPRVARRLAGCNF